MELKIYAQTGRLPSWDAKLGWIFPKEQHTESGGGGTNNGRVGDALADAAKSWLAQNPGKSYLQALTAVGPQHAADYQGEVEQRTGGLRSPS
jgi:hypothetical protein